MTAHLYAASKEDIDSAIEMANKIPLTHKPYKRKLVRDKPLGLRFKEIAAIEGITEAHAKWICNNAIKKIRRTYGIVLNKQRINK